MIEDKTPSTLLLTDDDEVTRYLLGEALTKLGYNVMEARNGREAIQLLGRHILSGVFLDVMMPGLNGFEVLREIRGNFHTKEIPVIIHTSKDLSPEEQDELSSLGAVLYPKREFSSDEGSEKLQELLKFAGMA